MENLEGIPERASLFTDQLLKRMTKPELENIIMIFQLSSYDASKEASDDENETSLIMKGAYYGQCLDYLNNK